MQIFHHHWLLGQLPFCCCVCVDWLACLLAVKRAIFRIFVMFFGRAKCETMRVLFCENYRGRTVRIAGRTMRRLCLSRRSIISDREIRIKTTWQLCCCVFVRSLRFDCSMRVLIIFGPSRLSLCCWLLWGWQIVKHQRSVWSGGFFMAQKTRLPS